MSKLVRLCTLCIAFCISRKVLKRKRRIFKLNFSHYRYVKSSHSVFFFFFKDVLKTSSKWLKYKSFMKTCILVKQMSE